MKCPITLALFACLLLLNAHPARCDVIWLKNGDRLTGEIVATHDALTLSFPFGGSVTVPRSAIKRWRTQPDEAPALSSEGVDLTLLGIEQEKWHLSGSSDVNLRIKQNTQRSNSIGINGKVQMENPSWRNGLESEYEYDTASGATTDHYYRVNPRIDYFLGDRGFWRSTVDFRYDMLTSGYQEIDYNTGFGYRFWKEKNKRLEFLLLGGQREINWYQDPDNCPLYQSGGASYPTLTFGWDYQHRLEQSRLEFFSEGKYLHYLNQSNPHLVLRRSVDGNIGLHYYLSDHMRLSWATELVWDDGYYDDGGRRDALGNKEWRQKLSIGASF